MVYISTSILVAILIPPIAFCFWNLACLYRNYQLALRIGIPIKVVLASHDNPVWILVSSRIVPIIRFFFGECDVVRYGVSGWENRVKYKMHEEAGDGAVIHVSPGHNWLYLCDAAAVNDMFRRREDFDRPPDLLAVLDVFGPNISTATGEDWQRQRKVTAAPFTDQNLALVWSESLRVASEALKYWKTFETPIIRTNADTRALSLNILAGAGFGKRFSFLDSAISTAEGPKKGHMFNYRDSLTLVLENCLLILVLGPNLLGKLAGWSSIFGNWARIGQATIDFKDHMVDMVREEKLAIAEGHTRSATITNGLVRASEEMGGEKVKKGNNTFKGLTENEIYGNLFVYNFAGHDTTAIASNWVLYLLAAYPEVQNWVREEIKAVLGDRDNHLVAEEYSDWYPKLNRCLAVLYETLRLWHPLLGVCKSTFEQPQPLKVGDKTLIIPPDTRICPASNALHTLPLYWGNDSLEWKPERWILSSSSLSSQPGTKTNARATGLENEYLKSPAKGAWIPWSEGLRVCPGKKFSQVEFVAIIVGLLRQHRVEVVADEGETAQEARERVKACVDDTMVVLLFQMKNPESVGLRWVEC